MTRSNMTRSNRKKSEQLGMSYGKACHRLRKLVMFRLMQTVGEDVCAQCGKRIESVDEVSVEHLIPWLDSADPVELFFELDNVTFSHLSCNSSARRQGTFVSRRRANGELQCSQCRQWKDPEAFTVDRREASGRAYQCRMCLRKNQRAQRSGGALSLAARR